jgi:hypothetical protein
MKQAKRCYNRAQLRPYNHHDWIAPMPIGFPLCKVYDKPWRPSDEDSSATTSSPIASETASA